MRKTLAILTVFVLFGITFTFSSCKGCKEEDGGDDTSGSTVSSPAAPSDPGSGTSGDPGSGTSGDPGSGDPGGSSSDAFGDPGSGTSDAYSLSAEDDKVVHASDITF